jgi:lipid A 3-O-deacylase
MSILMLKIPPSSFAAKWSGHFVRSEAAVSLRRSYWRQSWGSAQSLLRPCYLALLLVCATASVGAQGVPVSACNGDRKLASGELLLAHENDFFGRRDRDYTSGTLLALRYSKLESQSDDACAPGGLGSVAQAMNRWPSERLPERDFVFAIAQQLYTPADYRASTVVVKERPYAAWLFGRWAIHANDSRRSQTISIDLGLVGPAARGESSQNFFHTLEGYPRFQGWNNQLRNEVGLQISAQWRELLVRSDHARLIGHYGVGLGNIETYLNTGLQWKFGSRLADHHSLPNSLRPASPVRASPLTQAARSAQWFFGFDARAVAHNMFLDGNTFASSHSVSRKPLVADLNAGVAWSWGVANLAYTHTLRTREYQGQNYQHIFGGVSISVPLN